MQLFQLFAVLLSALAVAPAAYAENLTQPFPLRNRTIWKGIISTAGFWEYRIFSVGSGSYVANELKGNKTAKNLINGSFKLLDHVNNAFLTRRKERHVDACNMRDDEDWLISANKKVRLYQLGIFDQSCPAYLNVNDAIANGEITENSFDRGHDIIQEGKHALFNAIKTMKLPQDANWSEPIENASMERAKDGHVCYLDNVFAYRINEHWYIRTAISNKERTRKMPDWERHVINEWVEDTYNRSLEMIHYRYNDRDTLERSTAMVYILRGIFAAGTGTITLDHHIGALNLARRQTEIAMDQAADAVTKSNIAILALPMVLNFIPLAMFTEQHFFGMFVYVLLTDVLSCIPFLVQGWDLVRLSRTGKSYMTAFFVGNETLSQLEIMAANCHGKLEYKVTGTVFICVSSGTILLGVLLEALAYKYRNQMRATFRSASYVTTNRKSVLGDGH